MNREELRWFLPPAVIAVLVFLGVMTSFIAGGVRRTQTDLGVATEVSHNRANAVFTLTDETGEAELICIVSANPRNGALTVVAVPPEIPVDIAGSRQTLGASMAIGGTDMLMEKLAQVVPLPLHHYMTLDRTVLEHTLSALGVDGSAFFTANSPKRKWEVGAALCLDTARALSGAGVQVGQMESFFGKVYTDFSVHGAQRYDHFLKRIGFAGTQSVTLPGGYNMNEDTFTPEQEAMNEMVNRLLNER